MARELLLALDLGTTSVRALAVDAGGAVLARASRPIETRCPLPGWVEQDAEAMWRGSESVLREALARAGRRADEVAGIGVVSQRGTAIAWDRRSGEALAPALGWQDRRTTRRALELQRAGVPIDSLAAATRFEWLLAESSQVRDAARTGRLCLGTPDAWLGFRLSGGTAFVTDPGHAGCTGLYDAGRRRWSGSALRLFGIEEAWLPGVVASSAVVGETPSALLSAPVAIAARAGDQQAACFAQGVHSAGQAKLTLGTAAMLDLHTGDSPAKPPPGAYPLPLWELADGEQAFCLEGLVVTAAAVVYWLVDIGLLSRPEALDAEAGASSEGVSFVPALQGLGTPWVDAGARGLLLGLTRGTTSAHVLRAAIEGLAFRCVEVCEALAVGEGPLRVDGGLARSDALLQQIADVLGQPVLRAAESETTALGAAFLAALACGLLARPGDLLPRLAAPTRFEPRARVDEQVAARERWRRAVARARSDQA